MQKKLILGVVLALTLSLTSPVVAAEERPLQLPSIDIVEWIFGLLEAFELESSSEAMEPAIEPIGEEGRSGEEMGPGLEPNNGNQSPPATEMGPELEPNGESTQEMGPIADPMG